MDLAVFFPCPSQPLSHGGGGAPEILMVLHNTESEPLLLGMLQALQQLGGGDSTQTLPAAPKVFSFLIQVPKAEGKRVSEQGIRAGDSLHACQGRSDRLAAGRVPCEAGA